MSTPTTDQVANDAPTPDQVANDVAVSLAQLREATAPVMEAVEGYRVECVRAGYSEGLARKMAADYHAFVLKALQS